MNLLPGSVIAGKYRVERVLGRGGMGVVYAARHLGLDEMVAVKLIREERAAGSAALERFQREAQAAARIKSEHVTRVLDVDRLADGSPYIVMELMEGVDLDAMVRSRGTLPAREAAEYLLQACEGLAEAHVLGMVHRDLKLKNLFRTTRRDGRPLIKVIDFGVVKFSVEQDVRELTHPGRGGGVTARRNMALTQTDSLLGSVHYMAPEQIRSSAVVDARADVWSLGVCLYAMVTGSLPFDGDGVFAVCRAIQQGTYEDPRSRVEDLPKGLVEAIERALEKDPARRFASVGEFSRSLGPIAGDLAAATRIETILLSTYRNAAGPGGSSSPFQDGPSRYDSTLATTLIHTPSHPSEGARGRVESTMDGAAGALALGPATISKPRGLRPWFALVATIGLGGLAVAFVASWSSRSNEGSSVGASPDTSSTAAITAPFVAERPISEETASGVRLAPSVPASEPGLSSSPLSASSAADEASAREMHPRTGRARASNELPARRPTGDRVKPSGKPEPAARESVDAYDKF